MLFAGGGSGGHIFPNIAILERLRERGAPIEPHFLVSDRPLDAEVLADEGLAGTALEVAPLPRHPLAVPRWLRRWRRSVRTVRRLIEAARPAAIVATGGFVSGPAAVVAQRARVPLALVNLDAVPGRANRRVGHRATRLFSAHVVRGWHGAQQIQVPLRRSALCDAAPADARRELGLAPSTPVLLVCGGSQGASSLNRTMAQMAARLPTTGPWQVLHLCGAADADMLRAAYAAANIPAVVLAFCRTMGTAWVSADLAISRAGAGSVAEARANAVPTIFLPYPHHADEHQRLNAAPLVAGGGAVLERDRIDPAANACHLLPLLTRLMDDQDARAMMAARLRAEPPDDGAAIVADWVHARLPH